MIKEINQPKQCHHQHQQHYHHRCSANAGRFSEPYGFQPLHKVDLWSDTWGLGSRMLFSLHQSACSRQMWKALLAVSRDVVRFSPEALVLFLPRSVRHTLTSISRKYMTADSERTDF